MAIFSRKWTLSKWKKYCATRSKYCSFYCSAITYFSDDADCPAVVLRSSEVGGSSIRSDPRCSSSSQTEGSISAEHTSSSFSINEANSLLAQPHGSHEKSQPCHPYQPSHACSPPQLPPSLLPQ